MKYVVIKKTSKDTIHKKVVSETLVNPLDGITTFRGMLIEIWDHGKGKLTK